MSGLEIRLQPDLFGPSTVDVAPTTGLSGGDKPRGLGFGVGFPSTSGAGVGHRPGASGGPTVSEEEKKAYADIFNKPLDALPCHKDLPRLVRQISVEGERIGGSSNETMPLTDLCREALVRLAIEYDEDELLAQKISVQYANFVPAPDPATNPGAGGGPELAAALLQVLTQVVGEDRAAVRILKAANQSIIAPAVTKLKKTLEDVGLPFNSVRNGWTIDIRREWDVVVVSHRKVETSTPEGESSGPLAGPYLFEWFLDFTFGESIADILNIQCGIRTAELPAPETTGSPSRGTAAVGGSISYGKDEIKFRNLLGELVETILSTNVPTASKSVETRLKKIRTIRDKRIQKTRRKLKVNNSPSISPSPPPSPSSALACSESSLQHNQISSSASPSTLSPLSASDSSATTTKKKKTKIGSWFRSSSGNAAGHSNKDTLDLSKSTLDEFPTAKLMCYSSLKDLDLSSNFLVSIPDSAVLDLNTGAGWGTRLTSLCLDNNQLRTLPTEIRVLTKLRTLSVAHNHIQELPSQISCLVELTALNVDDNRLRALPRELSQLTKLSVLKLDFNPLLVYPPPKIYRAGVSAILTYLGEHEPAIQSPRRVSPNPSPRDGDNATSTFLVASPRRETKTSPELLAVKKVLQESSSSSALANLATPTITVVASNSAPILEQSSEFSDSTSRLLLPTLVEPFGGDEDHRRVARRNRAAELEDSHSDSTETTTEPSPSPSIPTLSTPPAEE